MMIRSVLNEFATIFDYPGLSLVNSTAKCVGELKDQYPEAAKDLQRFQDFAEKEGLDRMEEVYTRTFDITPTTTLYVGYHLFQESYKRGTFLVKLQESFHKHGFKAEAELADHLCVLLRFVGSVEDPEFIDPLLEEGILPILEKIEKAFDESDNGYRLAARALRSLLPAMQTAARGGLQND